MASLYEIGGNYKALLQAIEDGEIPVEAIADTLESAEGEFVEKVDNTACYIKNLMAESQAIDTEIENLQARQKAKKLKIDSFKKYLFDALAMAGYKPYNKDTDGKDKHNKFETTRNVLTVGFNPVSVCVDDEAEFIEYAKANNEKLITYGKPTISKTNIKELLETGIEVPHCSLKQGTKLTIK